MSIIPNNPAADAGMKMWQKCMEDKDEMRKGFIAALTVLRDMCKAAKLTAGEEKANELIKQYSKP